MHTGSNILLLILFTALSAVGACGQELTSEMATAIKFGKTEKLEHYTNAELINACYGVADSKKYNFLAISIKLKSMKSLRFFVENGADIEGVCADKTPLMYAAKYGPLEMVEYLVQKGAAIQVSVKGYTALDYARQFHHSDIRKFLKAQKMQ